MLYELNPNYKNQDEKTFHNSLGFREKEFSIDKKNGVYRIVCMGESSTYCTGILDNSKTYPSRLEFYFKKKGLDIEVINAGVPGYTSAENLLHFIFKVQDLKPDLVIFYFTHNDVHPRRFPFLSRDYREYSKIWNIDQGCNNPFVLLFNQAFKKSQKSSIGNLTRRYNEYTERSSNNVLKNPPNYFFSNIKCLALLVLGFGSELLFINPQYKNLEQFIEKDLSSFSSKDIVLNDINPVYFAVYQHRTLIEKVSQELNTYIYDLFRKIPYPVVKPGQKSSNEYYLDAVHFTEKGADYLGYLLTEYIFLNIYLKGKK